MTIEEAKKLGFKNYDPAIRAVPAWHGNDSLDMITVDLLNPSIHFPTRAKLRAENKRLAALEKSNRMDAAIARQNARIEARKSKDEEFSGFKYVGFSGTEAGSVDLYEAFLLDGTKTTVSDAELSANRDKYFPSAEAARLARLAEYRKSPDPITMEQANDLRAGDVWYYYDSILKCIGACSELTAKHALQSLGRYWTREAAGAALAKQAKQAKQEKPCDMPEKMELNGVKCRRLGDDEPHKEGDIPVDGSRTHRFGSVWYRPVASHETPSGETQPDLKLTGETQSTSPTTIPGWLMTIPVPVIRDAALRQYDPSLFPNAGDPGSLHHAILFAFRWDHSVEGNDFWDWCAHASDGDEPWPAYPTKAKPGDADNTALKSVGNKYHRTIHGVTGGSLVVDIYNILEAFGVTCPACQHAIKKLLCAGLRNKGSRLQDLTEAAESTSRAVTLEKQREQ